MAEKVDQLYSDAVPFDCPKDEDQTFPKTPASEDPKKESPKKEKEPPKKSKKKSESDTSDSDDDYSDLRSRRKSKRQQKYKGNIISIKNANNLHLGNKYNFSKVNTEIQQITIQKNVATQDSTDADAAAFDKTSQAPLSKELSESEREITTADIYEVAENISGSWKKLARFLPPRNVFSGGELQTLQLNNPNDIVEAIVDMLQMWQMRHPALSTIGNLAKTLHLIKRADVANKLKP